MKKIFKLMIIFVVVVAYVFIINIFASLISMTSEKAQEEKILKQILGGMAVEIGVGDSVSVSVTRVGHWYGRFYVNNGKYLKLFYFINLPWKVKDYNFWIFHLIFLVTLTLFTILLFIQKQKTKPLKKENPEDLEDYGIRI